MTKNANKLWIKSNLSERPHVCDRITDDSVCERDNIGRPCHVGPAKVSS